MARRAGSVGSETADKVRTAALGLFAARGYAAVSMRELAAQVGVQAAALYNHFPNKQALLVDLLRGHMVELIAAWKEEAVAGEAADAALERFVRFHIRYHSTRTDAVFVSYMELRSLEPDNFRQIEKLRQTYEEVVFAIIEDGVKAGLMSVGDARIATLALIAMLTGVNTWYRQKGRLKLEQIEEIYSRYALRIVGAKGGKEE